MSEVVVANQKSGELANPESSIAVSNAIKSHLSEVHAPVIPDQLYTGKYVRSNFSKSETNLRIKLAAMGCLPENEEVDPEIAERASAVKGLNRLFFKDGSPVSERVDAFFERLVSKTSLAGQVKIKLPGPHSTLILDEPGMAYLAALPDKEDPEKGRTFKNDYVESFELVNDQGVLHNPRFDRRTSGKETFHIADYGYPVPYDKTAVPIEAAARILKAALEPPKEDMLLPYSSAWGKGAAKTFVSLLANPVVVPGVEGFTTEERMETLVLAPGGCVSNLDFIERIFGNAGNQYKPSDNLFLNPEHWTGDTGLIIFAPHLNQVSLKSMGIDPNTLNTSNPNIRCYNNGDAFLLKIRDESGVVVTIIADNYFGLGKKTIMTDASFAADRRGLVMQEHAGGALVFPQLELGSYFSAETHIKNCPPFSRTVEVLGDRIRLIEPDGYAIDRFDENIIYLPENASFTFNSKEQKVSWIHDGKEYSYQINPHAIYFLPSGFSLSLQEVPGLGQKKDTKLVGCYGRGTFIHKSDSVSGAGKSELAKAVDDLLSYGSLSVGNLKEAFHGLTEILHGHWPPNNRFQTRFKNQSFTNGRPAIDQQRSFGSLEKLLTESPEYTDAYNSWLQSIPMSSKIMALHLHMVQSTGQDISDWEKRFKVSKIDGKEGHEIYFDRQLMKIAYLRMGQDEDGEQRLSTMRPDIHLSRTLKMEDDLTVSVCVPSRLVAGASEHWGKARRFVKNMERRFFNRTDGTSERGEELKAERDIAGTGNYLVNFEALPLSYAGTLVNNVIEFKKYAPEQQERIKAAYQAHLSGKVGYFCASDLARIIGKDPKTGKIIRSPNPRYMEDEDMLVNKKPFLLAELATRLNRNVPLSKEIDYGVDVNNPARRLNTTDYTVQGTIVPHIAVYPPLIMQEAPELIMDWITSVTGKSPSTTGGLGSEGAGTKGPFNCLLSVHYLNNQIKALALTDEPVVTTAAAKIGPDFNIGHDLSISDKEVLARVDPADLKLKVMLDRGYLEPDPDVEYQGQIVKGGNFYRLTKLGSTWLFGHFFLNSDKVFNEHQLQPELQDLKLYVEGMLELQRQHRIVALKYFEDGSINFACPPLKALLHIMAFGEYKFERINPESGKVEKTTWLKGTPEFRRQFEVESILNSDWYNSALIEARKKDLTRLRKHRRNLFDYIRNNEEIFSPAEMSVYRDRHSRLTRQIQEIRKTEYLSFIHGSIGADKL